MLEEMRQTRFLKPPGVPGEAGSGNVAKKTFKGETSELATKDGVHHLRH